MKSRYQFIALVLVLVATQFAVATPLDDYIKAPDDNYRYSVVNTIKGEGYTAYVLVRYFDYSSTGTENVTRVPSPS